MFFWIDRHDLHGRVAVLDGGYPAWAARRLPKEIDSVPANDIEAPGRAAQSAPTDVKYRATLQACLRCKTQLE
jgi:thiosulfate/3-mercaptopyruvate sulfurtransferase